MNLKWSERALALLEQIHNEIAEEQPAAAKRTVSKIRDAAEVLRMYPAVGRRIRRSRMRVFAIPGTQYMLLFRTDEDVVTIASVFHGAEDWHRTIAKPL